MLPCALLPRVWLARRGALNSAFATSSPAIGCLRLASVTCRPTSHTTRVARCHHDDRYAVHAHFTMLQGFKPVTAKRARCLAFTKQRMGQVCSRTTVTRSALVLLGASTVSPPWKPKRDKSCAACPRTRRCHCGRDRAGRHLIARFSTSTRHCATLPQIHELAFRHRISRTADCACLLLVSGRAVQSQVSCVRTQCVQQELPSTTMTVHVVARVGASMD